MATTQLDPRIARTRRVLQAALLDLAREQPLDEIPVAEIADRAEVNRSSFYQHYSDKETLLADALDAQAADVGADLSSLDAAAEAGDTAPPELVVLYTRHVHAHAALYRLALGEHGSSIAVARLRNRIAAGLPAYGSCAGMILLADRLLDGIPGQQTLGGLDITVRRNAFGRQVDSFETDLTIEGIDDSATRPMHAVFIRAPWVEDVGLAATVLGAVATGPAAGRIVAVRQGPLLVTSFHPEVTGDTRVHRLFVEMVRGDR